VVLVGQRRAVALAQRGAVAVGVVAVLLEIAGAGAASLLDRPRRREGPGGRERRGGCRVAEGARIGRGRKDPADLPVVAVVAQPGPVAAGIDHVLYLAIERVSVGDLGRLDRAARTDA